jgi:hypothetical protein
MPDPSRPVPSNAIRATDASAGDYVAGGMIRGLWPAGELMRKLLIPSILVFAAFVSPLSAQRKGAGSGAGSVTFAVAVTDPSGAPVSDVKVSVSGAAARTVADRGRADRLRTAAGRGVPDAV